MLVVRFIANNSRPAKVVFFAIKSFNRVNIFRIQGTTATLCGLPASMSRV